MKIGTAELLVTPELFLQFLQGFSTAKTPRSYQVVQNPLPDDVVCIKVSYDFDKDTLILLLRSTAWEGHAGVLESPVIQVIDHNPDPGPQTK